MSFRPKLLITIDTEGDNLWSRPKTVTTENARFLPRFQALCEKFSLKPTYLVNYEMALSKEFQTLGKAVLANKTAEIGLHLHAWDTPPLKPLTDDDTRHHPYLIEYPETVMREKIETVIRAIQDSFGVQPVSHRAGRWAFNETYAKILIEKGFHADCSVTPHISWRGHKGHPSGEGGSDYTNFPEDAYFLDTADIRRPGSSPLLEVPATVRKMKHPRFIENVRAAFAPQTLPARALNRFFPTLSWLRPDGRNLSGMKKLLIRAREENWDYVEFMLHSSEFMPGGSPTFQTNQSIDDLYSNLKSLFSEAADAFEGETLSGYYEQFR